MSIMDAERITGGWIRITNDDRVSYFRAETIISIEIASSRRVGDEHSIRIYGPSVSLLADSREQAELYVAKLLDLLLPDAPARPRPVFDPVTGRSL